MAQTIGKVETTEIAKSTEKEWTLMFFFAGDNQLSPSMVSQLKALKDAGFQADTNVVVRFDPNEKGARTRIFEVNRERKRGTRKTVIGDGRDPFVRNLIEDDVAPQQLKAAGGAAASRSTNEAGDQDTMEAGDALRSFLETCRDNYSARHYVLFLVGHGMIVGNDAFLPDDRPDSSITLEQLGQILGYFARYVKEKGQAFELVGMHSCSMSAVEVAYQLKGTANYMMATEGVSFVGSWPYRQLLKKIFHTIEKTKEVEPGDDPLKKKEVDVKLLLRKIHYLSLHNSTDFMFAGFSADLCLCNLNPKNVEGLSAALKGLTKALKDGLDDARGKELILLAHWRSQSYWQENYTDLYDFCRCLREQCSADIEATREGQQTVIQESIKDACDQVMEKLEPSWKKLDPFGERADPFDDLIVYSDYFGPTYQYSHGLSIYFPWSRPIEDGVDQVLRKYQDYAFTAALGEDSWLSFLDKYFNATQRAPREKEDGISDEGHQDDVETATGAADGISHVGALAGGSGKSSPSDSGGAGCSCASIKNYPIKFSLSRRASRRSGRRVDK